MIAYTYSSETRNAIIEALESAETALEALGEYLARERIMEPAQKCGRVVTHIAYALKRMDLDDGLEGNVVTPMRSYGLSPLDSLGPDLPPGAA